MATVSAEPSLVLDRVVTEYAAMVRGLARRRGLSEADLDEVLQDVRIRLWRALPTAERIGAVNTSYVYQAAMSAVCDLIRRRRGDRLESIDEQSSQSIPSLLASPAPDLALERLEMAERIDRTIRDLGAAQRPVVRMYLAGYTQAEIETTLGWSEGKTRNLLYRGLRVLRNALASQGIVPGAT